MPRRACVIDTFLVLSFSAPGRYRRGVAVRAAQRHDGSRAQSAFGHNLVGEAAD
nr:hypothetical protein JVH1_4190 [Rhodococcus sp. JVH1]